MTIRLEVRNAGKRYKRGWALRDCDATIQPSTITALVGPNGAGKSTLLAAAAGVVSLTQGEISVDGRPSTGASIRQSAISPRTGRCIGGGGFSEMLAHTKDLNTRWDGRHAEQLIDRAATLHRRPGGAPVRRPMDKSSR